MPAPIGSSDRTWPMPSRSARAWAAGRSTGVKTAMPGSSPAAGSELQHRPDALAGGVAADRRILPARGWQHFVRCRTLGLGRDGGAGELAAHPLLVDPDLIVLAVVVHDLGLALAGSRRQAGARRQRQQRSEHKSKSPDGHGRILRAGCSARAGRRTIPAMSEPVLLLVDGSSYLYRAYHALPDLRAPDGFPTGAIHGFIAMMKRLRETVLGSGPGGHAACVFDAPGKTFRDDWYPEYKAHRAPMPDELRRQIAPIHEVVRLLGWPVLEVPRIEADDAIGTLARVAVGGGHRVIISTGDKDLAQLVDDRVTLINTMSNERLDVDGVRAKFGVPPERIVDYLARIGDAVDNVPGVEKVGPKTAAKWIAEYGSLDGVVAAAPQIKGAVGENLRRALMSVQCGREFLPKKKGQPEQARLALRLSCFPSPTGTTPLFGTPAPRTAP